MLLTTNGLVIKTTDVGENDKMLTLLTPEHGKLSISAKGVKSIRGKNSSAASLFSYGNFVLYQKAGFYSLREASIENSFFGLTTDILKLSLASYICDVVCDITGEGLMSQDILRLTLNSFHAIANSDKPLPLIKAAFELRACAYSGFAPDISECFLCGETNPAEPIFDIMNGHVYCRRCLRSSPETRLPSKYNPEERRIFKNLTPSTLAAIRYVLTAPPKRALSFDITEEAELMIFSRVAEDYLLNHLERGFDTLDFYRSLI